jgi:hypothetical protein
MYGRRAYLQQEKKEEEKRLTATLNTIMNENVLHC